MSFPLLRFRPLPWRQLLLALGLLLRAAVGFAQPAPYYFALPEAGKGAAVPGAAASAWHVARVLDARADRSRLGTVRRGLDNLAAPAMLSQPLPAALLAYCRQQLPARAGSRPVVLRVLDVRIGEDLRATSETGEAELIGDFLEILPDSSFRVLLPVAEYLRRGGLDVTLHHSTNLGQVLTQALAGLAALPAGTTGPALTREEALAGRGGAPAFPVLAPPPGTNGLYNSFADFRDDRLSPPARAFELRPTARSLKGALGHADELEAYYLYLDADHPSERVPLGNIWGLSDGHLRYIVHRNRLYPLLPGADGRSFAFTAEAPPDPAGAASRTLVGGLLGGVAGIAVASATAPRPGLATYEVHLPTGRVVAQEETFTSADFAPDNPEAGQLYLYRRPDDVRTEPLLVWLNGREVARLLPQQYVRLPAPAPRTELVLCLQRPTATAATPEAAKLLQAPACLPVAPNRAGALYLECVAIPGIAQPPALRAVNLRTGTELIKKMQQVE